jgi:anti-anti-sigma factor
MVDDLRERLDAALGRGPTSLAVDMSAVEGMSSTTVAALLWVRRQCAARGIEMLLRQPSPRSLDGLRRAGLLSVLVVESADRTSTPRRRDGEVGRR